jgi:hypothetical protein
MRHIRRHQRQVVKLLIRPAPPTGPGAGDHERTSHGKARSQSLRGSHPQSPTTAQHLRAALAILTVTPPPVDAPRPGVVSAHEGRLVAASHCALSR